MDEEINIAIQAQDVLLFNGKSIDILLEYHMDIWK